MPILPLPYTLYSTFRASSLACFRLLQNFFHASPMDTTVYLTLRDDFVKAIHNRQLLDALRALQGQLSWVGDWNSRQEHERIWTDYQHLLRDFRQGEACATYQERNESLFERTYLLGLSLHHAFTVEHTQQLRAKLWQKYADQRLQQPLENVLRYEIDDHILFDRLYCAAPWTAEVVEAAEELMQHPNRSEDTRSTVLSAVTLSLLASFDPTQCAWLLRQTEKTLSSLLRVRLCVGLVYIGIHQAAQIALFPSLVQQWKAWTNREVWQEDLRIVQSTMLASAQSRDTATDASQLMERLSQMPDPSNAQAKQTFMREMASMVAERFVDGWAGVDIALAGFKQMYRRFPFFQDAANWFIPFSVQRPELQHLEEVGGRKLELQHRALGSTDLYIIAEMNLASKRFAERLPQEIKDKFEEVSAKVPDESKDVVFHLEEEDTAMLTILRNHRKNSGVADLISTESQEFRALKLAYNGYIHDSYRFFHLFVDRNEGENPYRDNLLLRDSILFRGAFEDEASLAVLGQLSFAIKDYRHALIFFQLLPKEHRDVRLRLAQCHHATGDYAEAALLLEKLVEEEDDESLLRLLSHCYDALHRHEDALVAWIRLEQLNPKNLEIAETLAQRFFDLQLYSDALEQVHKILYHRSEDLDALLLKAQCYLLMGRLEEAQNQYAVLLEKAPDHLDVLKNAAHCALLLGDIAMAARLYMAHLEQEQLKFVQEDFFAHALTHLHAVGFSPQLATFMRDLLNSELQHQ